MAALYEDALVYETGSAMTSTGALTAYSGTKTGRSPSDKRVVKEPSSEKEVWWGPVNKEMSPEVSSPFILSSTHSKEIFVTQAVVLGLRHDLLPDVAVHLPVLWCLQASTTLSPQNTKKMHLLLQGMTQFQPLPRPESVKIIRG